MKLQGISVLFALIVLPLILVLSYYIRLQVETINLQNQYDAKLLNSTRDALSAFEINTANEDLSSVSDSLRTIIEASSNVFINTLATNLGMSNASKSYIEPYVPSLLYTLYDGYYIYAPTRVPTLLTNDDGNSVAVGDIGVKYDGTYYTYTLTHVSQESQDNCTVCTKNASTVPVTYNNNGSGHITFDKTSDINNYLNYNPGTNNFPIKDYGQVLYVSKTRPDRYTTNIEDAQLKTKNVLKSYMPYSARYKRGTDFDISVVYTLDNYVTIEGTVGNIYYTKSGYLLPINCFFNNSSTNLNDLTANNPDLARLRQYSQEDAKKIIESGESISLKLNDPDYTGNNHTVITSGGKGSYETISKEIVAYNTRIENAEYYQIGISAGVMTATTPEVTNFINNFRNETSLTLTSTDVVSQLEEIVVLSRSKLNELQYELDKMSAMVYYVTGIIFTEWVQETLGDVQEKDLIEISGQEYRTVNGSELLTYKFDSDNKIFQITGVTEEGITEVPGDSVFTTHKLNVIRNSIQYNLNLAMSTYNNMSLGNSSYAMPVMEQEEWQKILTNPSIVSFLQGYQCGLKKYNNYMIVSSTNNEISVSVEDIYFVKKENFSNEISDYHKNDCLKLLTEGMEILNVNLSANLPEYIAFTSKEAKYDKIYNKHNSLLAYQYDHKNYACYDCINDGNYEVNQIFKNAFGEYKKLDEFGTEVTITVPEKEKKVSQNLVKAYYIGVGKCRNNLYKMNAIANPQGYEIIYNNDPNNAEANITRDSSLPMNKVKAIEIVTGTIKTTDSNETVLQYKVKYNGGYLTDEIYAISSNVVVDNTINVRLDPFKPASQETSVINGSMNSLKLEFENQASTSTAYYEGAGGVIETESTKVFKNSIKYIRIIYK